MPTTEYLNYIFVASVVTGGWSLYLIFSLIHNLKKIKIIRSIRKLVNLMIFSFVTASLSFLLVGIQGYKALTHEELIAKVSIIPGSVQSGSGQSFVAIVEFDNDEPKYYRLSGDEVMFEANVLKWKPWSNILGLKTAYRLDRVRGRYTNIEDERNKPATIYSLVADRSSDIAQWRDEYQTLDFLVDVEHGSASFTSAEKMKVFNLMMTTNGLLLRPILE